MIETSEEKRALLLHRKAIVINACAPLLMWDTRRRRERGEHRVLGNVHYPTVRKGGVDAAIVSIYFAVSPWEYYGIDRGRYMFYNV